MEMSPHVVKNVGLIGLGKMGKPMAHNLLRTGFTLCVYDVADAPVQELSAAGAQTASPRRSMTKGLPNPAATQEKIIMPRITGSSATVIASSAARRCARPWIGRCRIHPPRPRQIRGEAADANPTAASTMRTPDPPVDPGPKSSFENEIRKSLPSRNRPPTPAATVGTKARRASRAPTWTWKRSRAGGGAPFRAAPSRGTAPPACRAAGRRRSWWRSARRGSAPADSGSRSAAR